MGNGNNGGNGGGESNGGNGRLRRLAGPGGMQVQVWVALIGMVGGVALGVINRIWPEETAQTQAATEAATKEAVKARKVSRGGYYNG